MDSQKSRHNGIMTGNQTSTASEQHETSSSFPIADLTATVGAFATRMLRKKTERKAADDIAEQATKQRQSLLLETMMNIRRSLIKVSRTDLGDRFHFSLDFDDWQGWPRLVVRLHDSFVEEPEYPCFQVHAHDRNSKAMIEIAAGEMFTPEKISLIKQDDLLRISALLKKSVRIYLDQIETIVLNAEIEEETEPEARELKSKDNSEFEQVENQSKKDEISGDLFTEQDRDDNFLEQLPELDAVKSLSDSPVKPMLDMPTEKEPEETNKQFISSVHEDKSATIEYNSETKTHKNVGSKKSNPSEESRIAASKGMIHIPSVEMESLYGEIISTPDLLVDKFEVTNDKYAEYLSDGKSISPAYWMGNKPPQGMGKHPVVGLKLSQAREYAEWRGCRLPTSEEWELIVRYPDARKYPWGDGYVSNLCNEPRTEVNTTSEVDRYLEGANDMGCMDLIGNVWEWTELSGNNTPYEEEQVWVFGGSYQHECIDSEGRIARWAVWSNKTYPYVGFRCVQDLPKHC